jgi:hypothetical protein
MGMAARAMATVTKRAMVTYGDNMGDGYGEEAGRQATVATMAMGMGTARKTRPLMLQLKRGV